MKQSTFIKGTKYGFKEIPVGGSKTFKGITRKKLMQSLRNYNQFVEYKDMIMVEAEQVGRDVKVKRIY